MQKEELNVNPGDRVLVTVDNWFYAPDGKMYRAVFGRVRAARTAEQSLGVKPNGRSTNWYLEVGNVTIAGCQIHYVVRCDDCHSGDVEGWTDATAGNPPVKYLRPSHIYVAAGEAP